MLSAVFKQNISEVNKFNKSFSNTSQTYNISIHEQTSALTPEILVSDASTAIYQFNYVEIADLGRKYFITDIMLVRNGLYRVKLRTDVLSTWATQIKSNIAVIKRQESKYNLYLDDPEFKTYNYEVITTKKFPANSFDKELTYLLITNEG